MKNILIILADGFEEVEALVPIDVLRRFSFNVIVSGLDKKEITSTHNIKILCDDILDNQKNNEFDCVVLPGGMPGTLNLGNSKDVCDLVIRHYENNKLVCAICAAPSIFEKLGLLENKKATSYPTFLNSDTTIKLDEKVVKDENIITSKGAGTAFDFAYKIAESLGSDVENLKASMMFKEGN